MSMKTERFYRWSFWLMLMGYATYAAVFIFQSSFIYNGERFFTLFDDSMISMTYARNLAHGYGLVWNAGGPRVEGFTNPLWVAYMALFHLLPVPESKVSLFIQVSGAVFFIWSIFYVRRIARLVTGNGEWVPLIAVFLTAFYYPLTNWSLLGTEVSVLLLMTTAAVWMALQTIHTGAFNRWLYLLLGISTLVRFDMAVPFLVIWGFLFLVDAKNRRQHLLWGLSCVAVFLGGQTLLRKLYYGDWLPNTYYLKMTGFPLSLRITRGAYVLYLLIQRMKWVVFLLPFTILLFRRDKMTVLVGLVFLGQIAYSVFVGGDAWEHRGGANRYIALGMPMFMILFTAAAEGWVSLFARWGVRLLNKIWVKVHFETWAHGLGNAVLTLVCLAGLLYMNRLLDMNSLPYLFLQQPSFFIPGSERTAVDGLLLRQYTTPEATIAVIGAGNTPYFSHRYSLDLLGKSDQKIAHEKSRVLYDVSLINFRPGHIKWDYAYSLGLMQPDVVTELLPSTYDIGEKYLGDYQKIMVNGHNMYFRTGSSHILWDKLKNGQ